MREDKTDRAINNVVAWLVAIGIAARYAAAFIIAGAAIVLGALLIWAVP